MDGLRIDAVASMLYLDYDRKPGEWIPNIYGGNENLEAIAFFRKLNSAVFAEFPDVLMIAEESTAFPGVTKPVSEGGLGFNFKWNMGFANDMFEYISMDPIYRQYHHSKLTFPMMYAYSENFILPVSHDEVVHGKRSLIGKMYGEYDEKFAMMRAFMTFLMTMPGKKLTFMGTEFAQFREWDYENELEWFMLSYPRHAEMQRYLRRLNHLYINSPELWRIDDGWDGFSWLEADRARDNVVAYRRLDGRGGELIVVINYSPVDRPDYPAETRKIPHTPRLGQIRVRRRRKDKLRSYQDRERTELLGYRQSRCYRYKIRGRSKERKGSRITAPDASRILCADIKKDLKQSTPAQIGIKARERVRLRI